MDLLNRTSNYYPPSPILHYYVEMPNSLGIITKNHMKKIIGGGLGRCYSEIRKLKWFKLE
jgi:hypothetical protein